MAKIVLAVFLISFLMSAFFSGSGSRQLVIVYLKRSEFRGSIVFVLMGSLTPAEINKWGLDQAVTESQNCSCHEFSKLSHIASQSYYTSL